MSGGSMNHLHEQLRTILVDHETLFPATDTNGQPVTSRVYFKAALAKLHATLNEAANMLQAIEKEDSGDHGPEKTEEAYDKWVSMAIKMRYL